MLTKWNYQERNRKPKKEPQRDYGTEILITEIKNSLEGGFPGGTVVKNPLPIQGTQVQAWPGKISHVMEQLSPCATTTETTLYSPLATTTEAHAPRACAPQQEKPLQ